MPRDLQPGCWEADLTEPEYSRIVILEQGAPVAEVLNADDFPCLDPDEIDHVDQEARQTARVMASAPDLLAACKRAVEDLETGRSSGALGLCRAAIAKAEGGQS